MPCPQKEKAFARLLEFIDEKNGHFDTGVLGGRVIFHVLAQNGYVDKAYRMITRPEFPSYGNLVLRGATSLWEQLYEDVSRVSSMNHHFWGDISSWFIQYPGGIRLNPTLHNADEVNIAPEFIESLENAKAFHIAPAGKISTEWQKEKDCINLKVDVPEKMSGNIILPDGFEFENGEKIIPVKSGTYKVKWC